jgi:hypothetical protein
MYFSLLINLSLIHPRTRRSRIPLQNPVENAVLTHSCSPKSASTIKSIDQGFQTKMSNMIFFMRIPYMHTLCIIQFCSAR